MAEESYYEKESPFLRKTEDMMLYAYNVLKQFPKSEKFSLVKYMTDCMDRILDLGIDANNKYYKKTTLRDLDSAIDKLKRYMRLSYRLKYLPPKKYDEWSSMVVELGKIVGGWIKSLPKDTK